MARIVTCVCVWVRATIIHVQLLMDVAYSNIVFQAIGPITFNCCAWAFEGFLPSFNTFLQCLPCRIELFRRDGSRFLLLPARLVWFHLARTWQQQETNLLVHSVGLVPITTINV